MGELLAEKEPDSSKAEFLEPVTTRDVGIQCGKITRCTIGSIMVLNYIHRLTSTYQEWH